MEYQTRCAVRCSIVGWNRTRDRLEILAALGIPEVWRYDGSRLTVLLLQAGAEYTASPTSRSFPWLPIEEFAAQLQVFGQADETTASQRFRT